MKIDGYEKRDSIFSFIVEDWGECSAQCGEGIRRRNVTCKIFLEFSKTVAVLPDHKCPGPKPSETEICFTGLCHKSQLEVNDEALIEPPDALSLRIEKKTTYKWKEDGFTRCSESCLGGTQESKILCVDAELDTPVSPVNCKNSGPRPESRMRTCNDHPCPPRWNVSEFGGCSRTCGGGEQTRTVACIQEVRHGRNNVLRVDDGACPQPPPITKQYCSVVDCPADWDITQWTKVIKMKCGFCRV